MTCVYARVAALFFLTLASPGCKFNTSGVPGAPSDGPQIDKYYPVDVGNDKKPTEARPGDTRPDLPSDLPGAPDARVDPECVSHTSVYVCRMASGDG